MMLEIVHYQFKPGQIAKSEAADMAQYQAWRKP